MITSENILKLKPWNLETLLQECLRFYWSSQRENIYALSLVIRYKNPASRTLIKLILFSTDLSKSNKKFRGQIEEKQ